MLTTVDQIDPLYVDFTVSAENCVARRRADGDGSRGVQVICCPTAAPYSGPARWTSLPTWSIPRLAVAFACARMLQSSTSCCRAPCRCAPPQRKQREAYRIPQTAVPARRAQGAFVFTVVDQAGKAQRKDATRA